MAMPRMSPELPAGIAIPPMAVPVWPTASPTVRAPQAAIRPAASFGHFIALLPLVLGGSGTCNLSIGRRVPSQQAYRAGVAGPHSPDREMGLVMSAPGR